MCTYCYTCIGWRSYHAANPLDATRKYHVQEVHHGEWCLEFGSGAWEIFTYVETALVSLSNNEGTDT